MRCCSPLNLRLFLLSAWGHRVPILLKQMRSRLDTAHTVGNACSSNTCTVHTVALPCSRCGQKWPRTSVSAERCLAPTGNSVSAAEPPDRGKKEREDAHRCIEATPLWGGFFEMLDVTTTLPSLLEITLVILFSSVTCLCRYNLRDDGILPLAG